ncbi:hypothetical protein EK21DRAFT_92775 [Setomelanomma holmii]|uniref:Uncharacterized protein n=1 Tax=Setomelanomma holmii TaxID=210430 RepID=A0A9P4LGR5_9PLEO|nr:hypothetical protein EK21DRAFT_92775 [Setomelanomma holmii]
MTSMNLKTFSGRSRGLEFDLPWVALAFHHGPVSLDTSSLGPQCYLLKHGSLPVVGYQIEDDPLQNGRRRTTAVQNVVSLTHLQGPPNIVWRHVLIRQISPQPAAADGKWAFDFIPTMGRNTRRRGRRGGKRHKIRHAVQKQRETHTSDGISELCKRIISLRLHDNERLEKPACSSSEHDLNMNTSQAFSVQSVRHHWAPQFRPNSLPVAAKSQPVKDLTAPANCTQHPEHETASPIFSTREDDVGCQSNRAKMSDFFPLLAFMASPGSIGHRLSHSQGSPSVPTKPKLLSSKPPTQDPPPTNAETQAIEAACRTIALRQIGTAGCSRSSTPSILTVVSESTLPDAAAVPVIFPPAAEKGVPSRGESAGACKTTSCTMETSEAGPSDLRHGMIRPEQPSSNTPTSFDFDLSGRQLPSLGLTGIFAHVQDGYPAQAATPYNTHATSAWIASLRADQARYDSRSFTGNVISPAPPVHVAGGRSAIGPLIAAPLGSNQTFINLSPAYMVSPSSVHAAEPFARIEYDVSLPTALRDPHARESMKDFLRMGHSKSCWCPMHTSSNGDSSVVGEPSKALHIGQLEDPYLIRKFASQASSRSTSDIGTSRTPSDSARREAWHEAANRHHSDTGADSDDDDDIPGLIHRDGWILSSYGPNTAVSTHSSEEPKTKQSIEVSQTISSWDEMQPGIVLAVPIPLPSQSARDANEELAASQSPTFDEAARATRSDSPAGIEMQSLDRLNISSVHSTPTFEDDDMVILTPRSTSTTLSYEALRESYLRVADEECRAERGLSPHVPRYWAEETLSFSARETDYFGEGLLEMNFAPSTASSPAASLTYEFIHTAESAISSSTPSLPSSPASGSPMLAPTEDDESLQF